MDFATDEPNQYDFAEYFMTFWTIMNTKNRFNISKVYTIDMNSIQQHLYLTFLDQTHRSVFFWSYICNVIKYSEAFLNDHIITINF